MVGIHLLLLGYDVVVYRVLGLGSMVSLSDAGVYLVCALVSPSLSFYMNHC